MFLTLFEPKVIYPFHVAERFSGSKKFYVATLEYVDEHGDSCNIKFHSDTRDVFDNMIKKTRSRYE